jgi:hypothetical protein
MNYVSQERRSPADKQLERTVDAAGTKSKGIILLFSIGRGRG